MNRMRVRLHLGSRVMRRYSHPPPLSLFLCLCLCLSLPTSFLCQKKIEGNCSTLFPAVATTPTVHSGARRSIEPQSVGAAARPVRQEQEVVCCAVLMFSRNDGGEMGGPTVAGTRRGEEEEFDDVRLATYYLRQGLKVDGQVL